MTSPEIIKVLLFHTSLNHPEKGRSSRDTSVINAMAGVCAAISDVYSVALPCFLTWQLNSVPKAQKIALFGIFSLGLVVVAASGVRTYWLIGK